MPRLLSSTVRTRQPQQAVQFSPYWIQRGLVGVFDGKRYIPVRSGRVTLTETGAPKYRAGKHGGQFGFGTTFGGGTTDRLSGGVLPAPVSGFRSIVAHIYAESSGGGGLGRVFQDVTGSGLDAGESLYFYTGGNVLSYVRKTTPGTVGQWAPSVNQPKNRWSVIGLSHDQHDLSVAPVFFVDGSFVTTSSIQSGTSGSVPSGQTSLVFGNRASDSARGWDGMLGPILFFDSFLTASDQQALALNPWQVYAASRRGMFIVPGAPSSDHLIVGEGSTIATASSAGAVQQMHLLVGAGSTLGTTASAGSIGGSTLLVGVSSTQSMTSSDGAIQQTHLIAGASSQQATTATAGAVLATPTIVDVERSTVDFTASSVTPNGLTPTVFVRNRYANDQNAGIRFTFAKVSGVSGMTPVFDVDRSNMENSNSSAKFKWSYTGELGTWNDFGTTTKLTSPNVYRSSNAAAFTGSTVYIALHLPWPVSYTLPWLQSIDASPYISEPPSSSGNGYVFHTRSATTNGSTPGAGDVIPAQPLYSFKISSAGLAPDGYPKRKLVLDSGIHASEDIGSYMLKGAVEFLISEDARAITARDWFDIYVYPLVAAAGRAGGAQRCDFENATKTYDVNRYWHVAALEAIESHKTAMLVDVGATFDVAIDFHGSTFSTRYDEFAGTRLAEWTSAIHVHVPGLAVSAATSEGHYSYWAVNNKMARFCVVAEYDYAQAVSQATLEDFGADHVRALADMATAGEWAEHNLSGVSSQQAMSSGAGSIQQSHLIAGASSQQAMSVNAGVVSQSDTVFLSGASSHQSMASSAGSIQQTHLLVAAGCAIDHIASASAIVQTHLLGGESSQQSNSSSSGSVYQPVAGGGPLSDADIARIIAAMRSANPPIPVDVQKMNGYEVIGSGTSLDKWRGV